MITIPLSLNEKKCQFDEEKKIEIENNICVRNNNNKIINIKKVSFS